MAETKTLLTQKQKDIIWEVIGSKETCDDRDPQEVINRDFKGDEDAYLRAMAKFHSIPLN